MAIAHIIGLGKSGLAAAKLLQYQGWQVFLSDRNDNASLRQQQQHLAEQNIPVVLGHTYAHDTLGQMPDLVVVSPGVPWDLPGLVEARRIGLDVIGEMGLAWRNLNTIPWVGITGTNGKTTTTALVEAIFKASGLSAPACGNIGYAACELALAVLQKKIPPPDWVIAEISSYQIESSPDIAPQIGIWTTLTPDHLDRHKTFENYANIKAYLLDQAQNQVVNGDDLALRPIAIERWPQATWTSLHGQASLPTNDEQGVYLENSWVMAGQALSVQRQIVATSTFPMAGVHNQQNLMLAVAAALLARIKPATIARAIATFPGVPHRLEQICVWRGIHFINDSKATNYDAAEVGLTAVDAPVILIAGGKAKLGNDQSWLSQIQANVATVVLIGDAADLFAQRLKEMGYGAVEVAGDMENAVLRSAELAQKYEARTVLLSPACASFDQYANFEQRGDHFRQICLSLLD